MLYLEIITICFEFMLHKIKITYPKTSDKKVVYTFDIIQPLIGLHQNRVKHFITQNRIVFPICYRANMTAVTMQEPMRQISSCNTNEAPAISCTIYFIHSGIFSVMENEIDSTFSSVRFIF